VPSDRLARLLEVSRAETQGFADQDDAAYKAELAGDGGQLRGHDRARLRDSDGGDAMSPAPGTSECVSVTLTRDHAAHAARRLLLDTASEIQSLIVDPEDLAGRDEFDTVSDVLAQGRAALDQVAWGRPDGDVTLTLPADWLADLAVLMQEGDDMAGSLQADPAPEELQDAREYLRHADAGTAILDQITAAAGVRS
jgi:hypothetical protein